MTEILALIVSIALEYNVPPLFVKAIALTENATLNPDAINYNAYDGSNDAGIMQLNSRYFGYIDRTHPEICIREAVKHIKRLSVLDSITTWWEVAVAYNAGEGRVKNPPQSAIMYAAMVMDKYTTFSGGYVNPVIRGKR